MKCKIEFETDNQAFEDGPYAHHRILSEIADKILAGYIDGTIHDSNGNKIGYWIKNMIDQPEDLAELTEEIRHKDKN